MGGAVSMCLVSSSQVTRIESDRMRLGDSVQSKLLGLLKNPHVMKDQRGCRVREDRVKEMRRVGIRCSLME